MVTVSDGARFEIGRVPQALFGVLGRNFVNFLGLSVVLVGAPSLINQLFTNYAHTNSSLAGLSWIVIMLTSIISLIFSFILQAALVSGTISDLNGRKLTIGEMIDGKATFALPLLGLAILQGLATGLGFILLIVPGLIATCIWLVTVPALVVDRTGVMGAFGRSADLTRGHRWSMFAIVLVYFIITIIIGWVSLTLLGGVQGAAASARLGVNPVVIGVNLVFNVLLGMISATGVAVIYYELRRVREGVAPQALVDTFS
ncbi:MAG: hypothetical protein M3N05_00785 [Pseudomonadota bacterium]|nr:hypothetical protein [Pseudomonadota bacterium]